MLCFIFFSFSLPCIASTDHRPLLTTDAHHRSPPTTIGDRRKPLEIAGEVIDGVTEFSVTGSSSNNILGTQTTQHADTLPLPSSTTVAPPKSILNFKPTSSILDIKIDFLKTDPKPLAVEGHFVPRKEDGFQSLETIVKFKEAEAKLFQMLADEARREMEGYRQIVRAKSEKLKEEYATKHAKLCLQETEERRRRKLEELKFLENSHCDYHNMKLRMQAEIASLLERMEATKKMWI